MLYAVIQRFDSLGGIETSMTAEVRKLKHLGIRIPTRKHRKLTQGGLSHKEMSDDKLCHMFTGQ